MEVNNACNKILEIIENNYNISVEEKDKLQIMFLLKRMHGESYNSGMQEGVKVKGQFQDLNLSDKKE